MTGTVTWYRVEEYPTIGYDPNAPTVLLWIERHGTAIGRVSRYEDGDIVTNASGYHGFSFTHFAYINEPLE